MLTIYKASAGSGKTYTLAYEYIKILLGIRQGDGTYRLNRFGKGDLKRPHSRILAITFTNKATAEMKSRIIKELDELRRLAPAGDKDAAYAVRLMEEFKCSREDLSRSASIALEGILNDYGAFNISTIDAFFQTVLRSFAREIDRQGDYRLELDGRTALSQSIGMLFDELNFNPDTDDNREIFNWLKEQSAQRMAEGRDYNPFNKRSMMYRELLAYLEHSVKEEFLARAKEVERYLSTPGKLKGFAEWVKETVNQCKAREKEVCDQLAQSGLPLQKDLRNLVNKMRESKEIDKTIYKPVGEGRGYIDAIREGNAKKMFEKGYEASEADIAAVQRWLETIETSCPRRYIFEEIGRKINTLWALGHIFRYVDKYRTENNLLLISDSNSLLKTIIDGSDTPFIYEKIGLMLENFLIDEFQDTSRMQWENLRPMVGNSLSTADSLIIGDEKQSIYRFRGGDSALLGHEVGERDFPTVSETKGEREGENTNYRSAHDIVRFNNTLFYNLSRRWGMTESGYEGVGQALGAPTRGLTGCIRLYDLTDSEYKETAAGILKPEIIEVLENKGVFKPQDVALRIMGDEIMSQLQRGYRQSEIAVLCSSNEHGARIADYIGRNYNQIKLVSEEALLLRNSKSIRIIVSMLEILDRSLEKPLTDEDDAVGKSVLYGEDERDRFRLGYVMRRRRAVLADTFEYYFAKGYEVEDALEKAIERAEKITLDGEDESAGADGPSDISHDIESLRRIAPANMSALVQAIIGLKINADDRRKEMPYLTAFVDLVDEFMQSYNPTIHSFLSYWNDKKGRLSISPGLREEAVTIITVHKAKGLEWPCVHIPLMDWPIENLPESGWFDAKEIKCPEGVEAPPVMFLSANKFFGDTGSPFKAQYEQWERDERFDNLNVAYVAFTRAVRELHVGLLSKRKVVPLSTSILEILKSAEQPDNISGIYIGLSEFMGEGGVFRIGEPTFPKKSGEGEEGLPVEPAPDFSVSFNSMNKRFTQVEDLTTLSGDDQGMNIGNEEDRHIVDSEGARRMEKAAREGLVMHSILSRMKVIGDLDVSVGFHRKYISKEELARYKSMLEKAFERGGAEVARWFDPDNERVLNEQAILSKKTGKVTRADRIVWHADGSVAVVDYKFTTADRKEHYEQVRDYALSISRIVDAPVSAYLWYPLRNKIIRVDEITPQTENS